MKFGPVPVAEAEGATLVHGQTVAGKRFRKGLVLGADDVAHLLSAGVTHVTVARFEDGDVDENTAARRLADAVTGPGVRAGIAGTGRVNLFAAHDGLALLDPAAIDRVNTVDEGITIAMLRPYDRVHADQIVATVKIIPFAVAESALARATEAARAVAGGLVSVAAYTPRRIALLQTRLPGLQTKVTEKTADVVRARIAALGSMSAGQRIVDHDQDAIAEALDHFVTEGAEIVLVIGASATTDRRDVIPAAIAAAGGTIEHFGMPVDPGNLLVLARLGEVPVLALPGSARSPRIGGNDLVLERILAGVPVGSEEIARMGVGGLLKEIPTRPLPRATAAPRGDRDGAPTHRIAAVILGAGQSRRMGSVNKLLVEIDGKAMIQHAIDAARAAGADPVIVVTGHQAEQVRAAAGDGITFVHNEDFGEGLSTSLRTGVAAVPEACDGALVALGDMPRVTARHLRALLDAFDPAAGHEICVPTWQGKRGNPVVWARRFFEEMRTLEGDVGAKHLIGEHLEAVHEVPMYDGGILMDVDSPAALAAMDQPEDNQETR